MTDYMGLYKMLFYFLSADIHSNPKYNVGRNVRRGQMSTSINKLSAIQVRNCRRPGAMPMVIVCISTSMNKVQNDGSSE